MAAWQTLRLGIGLVLAHALLLPIAAAQPSTTAETPILRIEAGNHLARTGDAAIDASERVLVTASDDKTARIWSLPDLRPLGVLRPPIDADDGGRLYAVAVSPDGSLAAVGGLTNQDIQDVLLFDLRTRQVVRRITGLKHVVQALAFSPDGSRLAAGLDGTSGLRIWRVVDGALLTQQSDFQDCVCDLSFSADGRLAAASYDGSIRVYDRTGKLQRQVAKLPSPAHRIRFSPDGSRLAVGFRDAVALELRDAATLALLSKPDVAGMQGGGDWISRLAWSVDGRNLYAGGTWGGDSWPIYAWSDRGAGPRQVATPGFMAPPSAVLPLRDGRLIFVSYDGDIGIATADGRRIIERVKVTGSMNRPADTSNPAWRLRLASDGSLVEWVFNDARDRWIRFDAVHADLSTADSMLPGLTDWSEEAGALRPSNWKTSAAPTIGGVPVQLRDRERSLSVAVSPGRVLMGSDWTLRLLDANAKQLWLQAVPAAWRVNLSPDGRLAAAALGDGTIRWYRVRDGTELLALFVTPDAQRWVAFTPSGYFTASPGGEDLIGWHVNRGAARSADFFPASQFRDRYYRPNVVTRVLTTLDEAEALRQADAERGAGGSTYAAAVAKLLASLPPVATIVAPGDGSAIPANGEVRLRLHLRNPLGLPIDGLRVLADARPIAPVRAVTLGTLPAQAGKETTEERELVLDLSAYAGREVSVSVVARSGEINSAAARILLRVAAPPLLAVPEAQRKPMLYAVVVGVSAYKQDGMKLKLAAKDAADLDKVLRKQKGGLYRDVEVRLLQDTQVNRTSLLDALRWLERSTTRSDTAVVFLAGHGVNTEDREYFFLPPDADLDRPEITGISGADLLRPLRRMSGRVLVFLDTCYGGALFAQRTRGGAPDMTNILNEMLAANDGIVAYSATTGKTRAEERDDLGNGVFTFALLNALQRQAAPAREVRLTGLADYLTEEVKRLTGGRQKAAFISPEGMPNVPVFLPAP